ncbi:MAG: hypothetical protein ACOYYS_02120 [Chloroflexota bacterium]
MQWFDKYQLILATKLEAVLSYGEQLLEACFHPALERKFRWLPWVWIGALFLSGALMWGKFLNWGNINFNYHDWAEINAARLAFVQDAIRKGVFPLHMTEAAHLKNITDRYLVIPDSILGPQMILFAGFETGPFVYANTLFLYGLAALGLLWLRKKESLSLFVFSAVFFLFNFNGHIIAHLSIGHVTWWSYFIFPWIVVMIFQAFEQQVGWRWILGMSLLMFLMVLEGGSHQFAWFILFFMIVALSSRAHFMLMIKTILFATLLVMVRFIPAVLGLSEFPIENLGGYRTVTDLFAALVQITPPADSLPVFSPVTKQYGLGWWEYDLYVGAIGAIFLIGFGIVYWLRHRAAMPKRLGLIVPTFALIVLSMGNFYLFVKNIPYPMFAGERVSARIISIPFVILLFIAAICYQRWLANFPSTLARILQLGALSLLCADLWTHLKIWRVTMSAEAFPFTLVDLSIKVVGNHADPPYINAITAGAVISSLSLALLIVLSIRERRLS